MKDDVWSDIRSIFTRDFHYLSARASSVALKTIHAWRGALAFVRRYGRTYLLSKFSPQFLNHVLTHHGEVVGRFPVPFFSRCRIV